MLLFNNFYINKNFISTIWFRYIFFSFPYIFFFSIKTLKLSSLATSFNLLNNLQIKFKLFNKVPYLFDGNLFFNCFYYKFLVIYTNDFNNYISIKSDNLLSLSLVSIHGYFINNNIFSELHNIFQFFNDNYLFYQSFLFFFVRFFIKLILRLKCTLILNINSFLVIKSF